MPRPQLGLGSHLSATPRRTADGSPKPWFEPPQTNDFFRGKFCWYDIELGFLHGSDALLCKVPRGVPKRSGEGP